MTSIITATTLYSYVLCPHRVWRDLYGPQEEKSQDTNPFLELLWERGIQHEANMLKRFGALVDLSSGTLEERAEQTIGEMKKGTPIIYQGVLKHQELLGIPDILRKEPDGSYLPIDIKSGLGGSDSDSEEDEGPKLKKHYAVQLALYVDILQKLGFTAQHKAMIIDVLGNEVPYPLDEAQGKKTPKTWWQFYQDVLKKVAALQANTEQNKPALSGDCKNCPWYNSCKKWCKSSNDLTNIFYLGRNKRDQLNAELGISTVEECIGLDVDDIMAHKAKNKAFLKGVGDSTLTKIINRARVLAIIKKPVAYKKVEFPQVPLEIFFDIEDDPTRELVYLHGAYVRDRGKETFKYFLAKDITRDAEKEAWREFWDHIRSLKKGEYAVYYYSAHEKTVYRKLQQEYPDVISAEEVDAFFEDPNVIDLYSSVVYKHTDWPLSSYSIKDIATYLGFKWRDETPSGALSIQWYNDYQKTKDPKLLQRILDYNEDDCKATMVVKDGLVNLMQGLTE